MRAAVVSGLGPNGMLAVMGLLRAGYLVTAIEQRTSYARSIHLSLRRTYLEDLRSLDSSLYKKLQSITSSIEEIQHLGDHPSVVRPGEGAVLAPDAEVTERLREAPVVHVRLDELERVFFEHVQSMSSGGSLRILRGAPMIVESGSEGMFSAKYGDETVAVSPELIVVAEGGKSSTARQLGRTACRFSAPKLYISVHVDSAVGPITRRLDTQVLVEDRPVPVCFWATGHRDPGKGTWLVLEVPEALHAGRASDTFDRGYFERASKNLLGCETSPTPSAFGLRGTFRFEQQLLANVTAGKNLVFFGDVAGMGHHALGTGLELGACDLRSLTRLLDSGVQSGLGAYGEAIVESRIALLAFGLGEYYPKLSADPSPWLREVLERTSLDRTLDPRAMLEARIAQSLGL